MIYINRIRRGRRNPGIGPKGGFGIAEIGLLSRYPGAGPTDPLVKESVERARSVVEGSPIFRKPEERDAKTRNWELFPYQYAGVAFFMEQVARGDKKAGIFDPMGLGKTAQGVGSAISIGRRAFPIVVVAPKSAFNAWRTTFKVFSKLPNGKDIPIYEDELPEVGLTLKKREAIYLVQYSSSSGLQGLGKETDSRLANVGIAIFDEAHEIRYPGSFKYLGALKLLREAQHVVLLTGTPALNTALEVLSLVRMLEGDPYQNLEEFREGQEDWGREHGIELIAGNRPDLMDVRTASDAIGLQDRIRRVAARRSRKAVRTQKAAPKEKLQPLKERRVQFLDPEGNEAYRTASEAVFRKLAEGLEDKDLAAGTRDIRSFIRLAETLDELRGKLRDKAFRASSESELRSWLKDQDEYKRLTRQARTAYLPIPRAVRERMADLAIPAAVAFQKKGENKDKDLVFVSATAVPAIKLAEQLSADRDVFYYSGTQKGLYQNGRFRGSFDVYEVLSPETGELISLTMKPRRGSKKRKITGKNFAWALEGLFAVGSPEKGRSVVLMPAAQTGLSLPSGSHLLFLDRFTSPGLEDQMEDRINRSGREGRPQITYLIPEDVWGINLAHRLANRRSSIFAAFGERFLGAKDKIGDDYANPLELDVAEYRMEVKDQEAGTERDAELGILEGYLFIENPEKYFEEMVQSAWKRGRERAEAFTQRIQTQKTEAERKEAFAQEIDRALAQGKRLPYTRLREALKTEELLLWRRGRQFALSDDLLANRDLVGIYADNDRGWEAVSTDGWDIEGEIPEEVPLPSPLYALFQRMVRDRLRAPPGRRNPPRRRRRRRKRRFRL